MDYPHFLVALCESPSDRDCFGKAFHVVIYGLDLDGFDYLHVEIALDVEVACDGVILPEWGD
jgi:hypothetical protein